MKVPYLDKQAHDFATRNFKNFYTYIQEYDIDQNLETSEKICKNIYEQYKKTHCNFNKIIKLGYLFENNAYDNLYDEIKNINSSTMYNIYIDDIGGIFDFLFDTTNKFKRLSLLEKIDDSHKQLDYLEKCIKERIQYHFWCKKHHIKYNTNSHKHEILYSIYMYNRMKDIQGLLNLFIDKYKEIKYDLKQKMKAEIQQKIAEIKQKKAEIQQKKAEIQQIKSYYNKILNRNLDINTDDTNDINTDDTNDINTDDTNDINTDDMQLESSDEVYYFSIASYNNDKRP